MPLTNTWNNSLPKSLIFIDSSLDKYQLLADGVHQNAEVIILDPARNGIEQINEAIQNFASRQGLIEAISIFSHGSPGSLQLGNSFLNADNLESYGLILSSWKKALTNQANILLYGCRVAADIGAEFIGKLQQIIGVNIAASVNLTGNSKLGGNWDLEFTTGEILAPIALTEIAQKNYPGVLGTLTVTNSNDSGAGSLREAIATAVAGDTIIFDPSLANQTITLTSGQLDIDKDLIIDGVDAAGLTISGNNQSRIFDLQYQKSFTLKNLIIIDGQTTEAGKEGNGGAIKTSSEVTLTIENSQFLNNAASGEGGGAISAGHKSNTTITDSKFDGNDATLGQSERGGGAIITNGFSVLTIQNSEFTNNKGINGGAINTPSTALTVENSTFINNDTTAGASISSSSSSPRGFGGAIYTDGVSTSFGGDNGSIIIRDSLFDGNKGAGAGGAAFLFTYPGDNVIIENTQVLNNSVIFNQIEQAHGGGIRLSTGTGSIDRTTPVTYDITNTTFAGNTAESQGGGLWIDRKLDLTRVNIVNSTFSENKAENPDGTIGLGGAIAAYAPTNITNTTIANNYAAELSGAIYTNESEGFTPDIDVSNTIFDRNTAGQAGTPKQQTNIQFIDGGGNLQFAAVENNGEVLATANITAADPQLGELQEINGALVRPLVAGSPAIDAGTNANAPNTDQRGQQRPIDGDGNGSEVTDVGAYEFVNDTVPSTVVTNTNDSGAGSLREAIATAVAGDTITFDPSLANRTITLTSGQLEIDKDLIIDGGNAAGLTISGNNASRVFFVNKVPIVNEPVSATFKNLKIADGKTDGVGEEGAGAAIRTISRSLLTVEDLEFENNIANGEGGGAIYAGSRTTTTVLKSKFNGNKAFGNGESGKSERGGGAIAVNGFGLLSISDSEFTNNEGINGGAVNVVRTELSVENSTFINNDSTSGGVFGPDTFGYGGAIYTDGASSSREEIVPGAITIRNSLFDGNKGAGQGGGLFLFGYEGDVVTLENSTIINNSVIEDTNNFALGGGLRHGSSSELIINNSVFANNSAVGGQGGGLWSDSATDIVNTTFSGNQALSSDNNVGLGGAITLANKGKPSRITNVTVAFNRAEFQGGGIWANDSATTLTNTVFAGNIAENGDKGFNVFHNTNFEFQDGGGNLDFNALNSDDTRITANALLDDPQLGELQEINGVLVHPLQAGSPAIDAGTNANAPTTDQRGQQRPVDGDGNGSEVTDVGAYEFVDNTVPENNPPTVAINQTLTLDEGATSTIINTQLQVTDADGDSLTFTINALPNNGTLKLNDVALAVNDTFAQTDIDNGNLTYVHNDSETTGDTVSLSASDGNGGNLDNIDFNIEVNAVNDRPTNINIDNNSIAENSDNGTVIGQLSTVDAEPGDSHSYTLVDDAGGRFAIEGEQLVVADGSKLDFESKRRHNITVQTTDSGTPNKSFSKQLTIGVTDIEETTTGVNRRGTNARERLAGTPQEDTLAGAGGNDTLFGGGNGDLLRGGAGRDRLNGGSGADTMRGGAGNDFYIVDDSNDRVIENPNEGADGVRARISYRLPVNLERLVLDGKEDLEAIGNSTDNRITGNSGNNKLVGAAGKDTIFGNSGSDTLSGGSDRDILMGNGGNDLLAGHQGRDRLNGGDGRDTMRGGADNDLYFVNSSDDQVIENADEGKDTVKSSATYRLPDNLERLVLTGKDDIDGIGNSLDNRMAGNSGNNQLSGAAGNDTIFGTGGRDTLGGGGGHDILLGGTDRDILKGHRGRDRLNGFNGDDTLTGGLGADLFIFNTNERYRRDELGTDVITDFTQRDQILLDRRTFTAITSDKGDGFSVGSEFEVVASNAAAAVSDAFVVYNQTNGNLFYNPNGSNNGLGSGGLFATLTDAPALAESDFVIR